MTESSTGLVFSCAEDAAAHIAPLRAHGKKLVTSNGCFDIIHAGHIRYLTEAAAEGDILVVGINSDESVRRLKGAARPIQPEQDRALIVASLKMVHCTFIFREQDPRPFLSVLKPDCHVKGGDYSSDIIERPVVESYGGKVKIVSFVAGRSSSGFIEKIRTAGTGA